MQTFYNVLQALYLPFQPPLPLSLVHYALSCHTGLAKPQAHQAHFYLWSASVLFPDMHMVSFLTTFKSLLKCYLLKENFSKRC